MNMICETSVLDSLNTLVCRLVRFRLLESNYQSVVITYLLVILQLQVQFSLSLIISSLFVI
jgi:hypothetical protein